MAERIGVLVIGERPDTRSALAGFLMSGPALRVVGQAASCADALPLIRRLRPGIIVYEAHTADPAELRAIWPVAREAPYASVIVVSFFAGPEHLREAMAAGAREYLARPFRAEQLVATVQNVHTRERERRRYQIARGLPVLAERRPRVITVFSTKGGVGKTTLAVNLAVAFAQETRNLVPVVDLDLHFGGVSMVLGVHAKRPLSELAGKPGEATFEWVEKCLVRHPLNVAVLALRGCPGPGQPAVLRVLDLLACGFDVTVVDTHSAFDATARAALDTSDLIVLVTTPDVPTVHNVGEGLAALTADPRRPSEKVRLVINRAGPRAELTPRVIEEYLGLTASGVISDAPVLVNRSVNRGVPFVASHRFSRVAREVRELAVELLREPTAPSLGGPPWRPSAL